MRRMRVYLDTSVFRGSVSVGPPLAADRKTSKFAASCGSTECGCAMP